MKFEVDGRRFVIDFEYPDTLSTAASLVEVNTEGAPLGITTATVVRYYKDAENKEKARKAALKAVLNGTGWGKRERLAAWTAYLTRSPKNKYGYRLKETPATTAL